MDKSVSMRLGQNGRYGKGVTPRGANVPRVSLFSINLTHLPLPLLAHPRPSS